MNTARALREARRRAGLSQRELAQRTGVPQSTIGRIESGVTDPRCRTLSTLLRACGSDLEAMPLLGEGIDRTQIRELLALSPRERVAQVAAEAHFLGLLDAAGRSLRSGSRSKGAEPRMKRAARRPKDRIELEILGALRDEIERGQP